ncbi:hypothetical protein RclHR1_11100009 [Rhizophagus clarus]|uniref:Uncharacterized protein n=1 Tax=Rhizophagus clarus TaxID=94130 RepID=A0A2Z6QIF7_9GLOM|nr:hypothetical protein RclHR1_11100009 [Rhizophagus clarus]GET04158.1 hypothetical protein RCL_jg24486.t1 [Rhizophagus clarus]
MFCSSVKLNKSPKGNDETSLSLSLKDSSRNIQSSEGEELRDEVSRDSIGIKLSEDNALIIATDIVIEIIKIINTIS